VLYLLSHSMSDVDGSAAESLLAGAVAELDDVPHATVAGRQVAGCNPGDEDGVLFFNGLADAHADEVEALLERAAAAGAVLLPVAMDREHRTPPAAAGAQQSFDVTDQLRRRELPDRRIAQVGRALAREALSLAADLPLPPA
jgi:hypothetical protein